MSDVIRVIHNRTSLRQYAAAPIKQEHQDLILASALRAPTAGNMMMYSILVVKDENKKKQLSKTCDNQPFIAKAPLVLIFLADMQRLFDYYDASQVKDFCQAQGLAYTGPDEADLLLASCDALIAAQNAVIAAESMGIGSCYVGDIIENYEIHREMFDLPPWVFPITMLCLGYYPEGANKVITPRYDQKHIVYTDKYQRLDKDAFSQMYREREENLAANNKFGAKNFGQALYARKTGADFSKEMARSVKVMLENWRGGEI